MQSLTAMSGQLEAMARPEVAGFGDAKKALEPALRRPHSLPGGFRSVRWSPLLVADH